MPLKTYTEQLEEVQNAITEVLENGQSFQHDTGEGHTRRYTRADLAALQAREKYLMPHAKREARNNGQGGMRVRLGVPG